MKPLSIGLLIALAVVAQQPEPLRFEVASIRRNVEPPMDRPGGTSISPTRLTLKRASLESLIRIAWEVKDKGLQIAESKLPGPDFYDIEATTTQPVTKDQMNLMLQTLLMDRFKLMLHTEKREYPVFALLMGKDGSKLKAVEAGTNPQVIFRPLPDRQLRLTGDHAPMWMLVDWLKSLAGGGKPILDKTGLTGTYNFVLEFQREQPAGSADQVAGASVFTAVQDQLGLRLDSQKAMLETLVIDHVEKTPTEN